MNAIPQPIEINEETVILSRADWEAMLDLIEDRIDQEIADRSLTQRIETGIKDISSIGYTIDETRRLLDGANPITVIRERRNMTQDALAIATNTSVDIISQIESGRKDADLKMLKSMAEVLNVDIGLLID